MTKDDMTELTIKDLEERDTLMDTIMAEIEQIDDTMGVIYNRYVSLIEVRQIINKYKTNNKAVINKNE